jgi:acetyl-CoA C-acetyltransferase
VPRDRWVFPLAAVESNSMVPLSQRGQLHRCPAVRVGGEQLAALSGIDPRDADYFDLYSCFPSAVQVQADELEIRLDRPFTVTGGMTFAGGPLDNYNFQALVKMVEVLREAPGTTGLVTCVSGMITKQGMVLWSTQPPACGFRFADVSDETRARTTVLDLAPDHDGPARVDGYTIVHDRRGTPERAIVVATAADGRRCVAASTDTDLAAAMVTDEWVGRDVQVAGSTFR